MARPKIALIGAGQIGGALAAGSGPDFANMSTEQFEQWLQTQG